MADIEGGLIGGTTDAYAAGDRGLPGGVLQLGDADATAPAVANIDPAPDTELEATDLVEFDVYDVAPGFAFLRVDVEYSNDLRRFVVHDGTEFRAPFATYSTRTGSGSLGDPYHFTLRPDGGWQEGVTIEIFVVACDTAGNVLEGS